MTDFRRGLARTPRIRAPGSASLPQAHPWQLPLIKDLWSLNKDTKAIALTIGVSESAVYNSLHRALAS